MAGRHVETLKRIYRRMPSGLRESIPVPVETWLRSRLSSRVKSVRHGEVVRNLDRKLWGGFSTSALASLEIELAESNPEKGKFAEASYVLAQWYSVQGDFLRAVELMETLRAHQPKRVHERRFHLVHALTLCRVGRALDARALLEEVGPRKHFDTSHALAWATAWSPEAGATEADAGDHALDAINSIYRHYGLAEISLFDPNRPLSLDNLSTVNGTGPQNGPLVSVIIPLYNAENTVGTALRGLAAQTHADLEVLIVDDCSTDNSADVVADFCARDPRFRLIRQEQNGGAYKSRNRALAEAKGEYITVHDSDDWSHPERIARHLDDLQPRFVPFNISDWVRTSTDLCFWGPWRPQPNQPTRNFSSVFFHRDLTAKAGPWDVARVSADREFINRVQSLHGLQRQLAFLPGCPLALGRLEDTSLTRTGATHAATMYHGLRRDYHEAGDLWHEELRQLSKVRGGMDGLDLSKPPFFPVPASIRPDRGADAREDLLFIGDYNFNGGTQKSALNMIGAARAAGFRTAMMQYRRYDQDVARRLNPDVRRFAWNNDVRIVAPGEKLRAETVVVTYPPILDHVMDRFPVIDHDRLLVIVNQMAERDNLGKDVAYDPLRVRENLTALLGSEGQWIPISERVRRVMQDDARYPAPSPETWRPMVDTAIWCARTPLWRGDSRKVPVIGRHGRDHPLKWLSDPDELRAAYCADKPCKLRFLGGARHARRRISPWPSNWNSAGFGAEDVREFLADLDFFIHYPDVTYIEEFGRAPMEAMAVGVPVILPPVFEPTFGKGALYAEPGEVWPLIDRLWQDRAAWQARVDAGRAFVQEFCSYAAFPGRIERLRPADEDLKIANAS